MAKLDFKLDMLDKLIKLYCKFDEFAKLRMSSMNLIIVLKFDEVAKLNLKLMSWIS